jgi:hypothetical protein
VAWIAFYIHDLDSQAEEVATPMRGCLKEENRFVACRKEGVSLNWC